MKKPKISFKKIVQKGSPLIFRKKIYFYFIRYYYSITIVNKGKNYFMIQKVKTRILGGFFKT